MAVVSIEEIMYPSIQIQFNNLKITDIIFLFFLIRKIHEKEEEVEKFVDLWLKKKNKKQGGLRRLLGKTSTKIEYILHFDEPRPTPLLYIFFFTSPKSSFLDSFLQGNLKIQILKKRISRSIKIYAMNRQKLLNLQKKLH
ncbi:hypothetical protein ACJX0J_002174 [Zea mays]